MKIDRKQLVSELLAFSTGGNGIIVGKPGVGKSFAIADLRDQLKQRSIPHLILPVERLGEGTESEVRSFLRRDGDFIQLLRDVTAQTKSKQAVLIFDGFDAARGERQREGILR